MKSFVELKTPNYFALIQKVGSQGNYQLRIFLIFLLHWFVATILLMGTSLLYLNPPLQCSDKTLSEFECKKSICGMDQEQWAKHISRPLCKSLATQFGSYQCENENILNILRSILYFGVLCGYLIFLFFANDYGRRFSMLLSWGVTSFGLILLSMSWNMASASIGMFLTGAGCQSSIRISLTILSEVVEKKLLQKCSVALQSSFGVAGVLIGVLFYQIKEWRIIITVMSTIPSLFVLLLFALYLEETPKFLLKQGAVQTLASLKRISEINGTDNVQYDEILPYIEKHEAKPQSTPFDLFRNSTLCKYTMCVSGIFFTLTYLYIGPIVIVDQLGYSPFRSQIIVSSSQIIVYPLAFCLINLTPRKQAGYLALTLSAIFTTIILFIKKPTVCDHCFEGNLQIVMVFCSRFCVSMYFTIFFVYVTEIFPLSVRAPGFGVGSSAGAVASTSSQFILPFLNQHNISPMFLFTAFAFLTILFIKHLPETLNVPLQDEIDSESQNIGQSLQNEWEKKKSWSLLQILGLELKIMISRVKKTFRPIILFFSPKILGFVALQPNQSI